jgi:hypothetical protein
MIGCLILASIGLLLGVFLALFATPASQPASAIFGLTVAAICIIPWVSFGLKKTREQSVRQLQGQMLQTPLPKPEPPQEQPRKRQWIHDE